MKITVPDKIGKKKNPIKRLDFFSKLNEIELDSATILTGANGSGKTSFINAVAAGLDLCDQYSSRTVSQKVQMHSSYLSQAVELYGLLKTDSKFDEVFCFRGDQGGRMPLALDSFEDVNFIFGSKGSHGEVNINRFANMVLKPSKQFFLDKKSILLLMDEPDCGFSPEYMVDICAIIEWVIISSIVNDNCNVIITTQNPLVLYTALDAGATRIDLGGWQGEGDPFITQFELLVKLIKKRIKKIENN
jgi:predicted ATPase